MRINFGVCACLLIAVCLVAASAQAAASYTLTDYGAYESAFDINNLGQVVGPYTGDNSYPWWGRGINDLGRIIWTTVEGENDEHGVLWKDGVTINLGTLGGYYSQAHDINNHDQVVGGSTPSSTSYQTGPEDPVPPGWGSRWFLWEDGVMTDLGSGDGSATAINDHCQIVGTFGFHGYLWQDGVWTDLGELGMNAGVHDINNHGQVVGSSHFGGANISAFLWENGTMHNLGSLGGTWADALEINERGQVVGRSRLSNGEWHAFLWEEDIWGAGTMYDLNSLVSLDPGWVLTTARAINDHGWIVGEMTDPDGVDHAYLLTPVPEPGMLAVTGLGLLGLLLAACRPARRKEPGRQTIR
jgi:probable HAF family extracellular repeat protein